MEASLLITASKLGLDTPQNLGSAYKELQNQRASLFLQILMAVSFLIGGYQDLKERLVSDLVWIPAIVGIVLVFYFDSPQAILLLVLLGVVGAIAFASTWLGFLGDADGIALIMILAWFVNADLLALALSFAAMAALVFPYLYLTGMFRKEIIIPIQQFKSEAKWIPKAVIIGGNRSEMPKDVNVSHDEVEKITDQSAMVEVQYGVANITVLAVAFAIYLAYIIVFQTGLFLKLP